MFLSATALARRRARVFLGLGLGLGFGFGFWFVFENWCLGGRTIPPSAWRARARAWPHPPKNLPKPLKNQ